MKLWSHRDEDRWAGYVIGITYTRRTYYLAGVPVWRRSMEWQNRPPHIPGKSCIMTCWYLPKPEFEFEQRSCMSRCGYIETRPKGDRMCNCHTCSLDGDCGRRLLVS